MRVILLQNLKGYGQIGDIKNVSDGYARNFLLPKRMAKMATDVNLKEADLLKQKNESQQKIMAEKGKEIAEKINGIEIELKKKISKTGTLFASVTKEEVAKEVSKIAGGKIETDMINFDKHGEHIKHAGDHVIKIELTPEVQSEIKLKIIGE